MRAAVVVVASLCAALAVPAAAQRLSLPERLSDDPAANALSQDWTGLADREARVPLLDSRWQGGLVVSTPGVGLNPARIGSPEAGFRLNDGVLRTLPRPPQVGPEPDPGSEAGAYLGYRVMDNLMLSSAVRQTVGAPGLGGTRFDFGASYGFNLSPRHLITLAGNLRLGQATGGGYPVSGADLATQWGYRASEPGAGFRLSWRYAVDRNLFLTTTLGYDRAADGVDSLHGIDRSGTSFGTVFGYRW